MQFYSINCTSKETLLYVQVLEKYYTYIRAQGRFLKAESTLHCTLLIHVLPPFLVTFLLQVVSNVLDPVLQNCAVNGEPIVSQENFLVEFKRVAESVALHLREQPVIVAHSESTFDGSGIKRLLSNKFELDKVSF